MAGEIPDVPGHVGDAFTKKIGPLPGWGWAAIVVGGAWGFHLYKTKYGVGTAATAAPSTADPSATSTGYAGGGGQNDAGITPGGSGSVAQSPTGSPAVTTNAQWARATADGMIAGGSNPTDVTNALSNYLNGRSLNATQQAIVNMALTHYGSPPEGIVSVVAAPAPKPVTVPAKPAPVVRKPAPKPVHKPVVHAPVHKAAVKYVVRPGDNLSEIAQRYYGRQDWQKIYGANRGVIGGNPNRIYAGTVLTIPA